MTNKEKVYEFLKQNKIPFEVTEHAPVYTMEDMVNLGLNKQGCICKNLFIRNQKGKNHYLISAIEDTKINLKELGTVIEAGKVSFASQERL